LFTNLVRPTDISSTMSFTQITIGFRVSAPRGPFLDLNDDKKRKRRSICFGDVSQSAGNNEWIVRYDYGREMREKSTHLKMHTTSAGRLPVTSGVNALYYRPNII